MALIDKIADHTVSNHALLAGIELWLQGTFTKAEMLTMFPELDVSDEPQADEIQAKYDATSPNLSKLAFLRDLHSIAMLLEDGRITIAQAKALYGMT